MVLLRYVLYSCPRRNVQVPTGKQLHSELVRTTILKDFAEFEGISKCVYVWFGLLTSFLI